jgi:hypothetical protein
LIIKEVKISCIGQDKKLSRHNYDKKVDSYISRRKHWVLKPQNAQVWQKNFQMVKRNLVKSD